jgi:hypothetical protein
MHVCMLCIYMYVFVYVCMCVCIIHTEYMHVCMYVFLRFITKKVCTASSRTSYIIIPLTNLNKYLHYVTSETEVHINIRVSNDNEKL